MGLAAWNTLRPVAVACRGGVPGRRGRRAGAFGPHAPVGGCTWRASGARVGGRIPTLTLILKIRGILNTAQVGVGSVVAQPQ